MTKDKDLEELFLASKPQFTDGDAFMATLARRLDAVEYVRQQQAATLRRYRVAMAVAFLVGIVSGAAVVLLSLPAGIPIFSLRVQTSLLAWIAEDARLILASLLPLVLTLGIVGISFSVMDTKLMRIQSMNRAIEA